MGNAYYSLLVKAYGGSSESTVSAQFMERNEAAVLWKEKFDIEYKNLSEVAKISATYHFLNKLKQYQEATNKTLNVKAPRWMPPASLSNTEYQLLNEKVLIEFANQYNSQVATHRNNNKRFKEANKVMIEQYIEDVCK